MVSLFPPHNYYLGYGSARQHSRMGRTTSSSSSMVLAIQAGRQTVLRCPQVRAAADPNGTFDTATYNLIPTVLQADFTFRANPGPPLLVGMVSQIPWPLPGESPPSKVRDPSLPSSLPPCASWPWLDWTTTLSWNCASKLPSFPPWWWYPVGTWASQ